MILWLASGSPRRLDLLERVGFQVSAHPPAIDETWDPSVAPEVHAQRLAEQKVATAPAEVVAVAADTVVHLQEPGSSPRILDKPTDRAEARAHLQALSGRWHRVTTGVAVRRGERQISWATTTEVRFRALHLAEIDAYLATGEADDKAGAYGIQGRGGALVAELRGSWTNVMGLPLEPTLAALAELGVRPEGAAKT